MKRSACVLTMILALLLGSFGIASAADSNAGTEFQEILNSIAASFDKKNVDGIVGWAHPKATLHYSDGTKVKISQWKENNIKFFEDVKKMRSKFTLNSFDAKKKKAKIVYTEIHDYSLKSEKRNKYNSTSKWEATLVKGKDGWRFKKFIEISESMKKNGKPFVPSAQANKI